MAGSTTHQPPTTGPAQPRAGAGAGSFPAEPVDVTHVVVPLDGSPFAERALPVAAWAAEGLGADIHLVEVVTGDEDVEGAIRYLDSAARRHHATSWDVVQQDDVVGAVADAVAATPGRMACMATHGRDRAAALIGSVAAALLGRSSEPVLLAGPDARPVPASDAPVVVAVDGTPRDEPLVTVALGWAAALGRGLEVVTVAEPTPAGYREPTRRARGPADPEAYLGALVARASGAGVAVTSQVVYEPVSVRDGLVPLLDRRAALVVLGSRRRTGVPRLVLGSHAARIVHDATVPALAVPLPHDGEH